MECCCRGLQPLPSLFCWKWAPTGFPTKPSPPKNNKNAFCAMSPMRETLFPRAPARPSSMTAKRIGLCTLSPSKTKKCNRAYNRVTLTARLTQAISSGLSAIPCFPALLRVQAFLRGEVSAHRLRSSDAGGKQTRDTQYRSDGTNDDCFSRQRL